MLASEDLGRQLQLLMCKLIPQPDKSENSDDESDESDDHRRFSSSDSDPLSDAVLTCDLASFIGDFLLSMQLRCTRTPDDCLALPEQCVAGPLCGGLLWNTRVDTRQ